MPFVERDIQVHSVMNARAMPGEVIVSGFSRHPLSFMPFCAIIGLKDWKTHSAGDERPEGSRVLSGLPEIRVLEEHLARLPPEKSEFF
jgi:hypothetical protein